MEPYGVTFRLGGSGADVSPMVAEGVPGIGMEHAATHYFDIHHTQADTFDKVEQTTWPTTPRRWPPSLSPWRSSGVRFQ